MAKHKDLGSKKGPKTTVTTTHLSFKGLLFVVERLTVAIHVGHFYPGQYFIRPSERTFCFLFLWFGLGWAVGREEQPKPKCRCSAWQAPHGASWPDKSRERNTAIYLYSLWFCVLRPRLPDPGWIFHARKKTDGWFSIDILKGTLRMNVRSICVNRVWGSAVYIDWRRSVFFFKRKLCMFIF